MAQFSKLDKAKAQLVLDHPFVASILLKYPLKERTDIPTMAVDKRGQIYINPQFVESLTVPQLVHGLAHETFHKLGMHAQRAGTRIHKKWNDATDAWINDTLVEANIGTPIEGGIYIPGSAKQTCEDIYASMPDPPKDRKGKKGGQDDGDGEGQGGGEQGGGIGSDLLEEGDPLTESEKKEIEARNKIDVAEAAQAAKARGKLPGCLADFAAAIIESKTPWFEILERYLTSLTKGDSSWKRPNRRYISQGYYLPSVDKVVQMGKLGLLIDISGSVSQQEIKHYNGHMKRMIDMCRPTGVDVVYCDTHVHKHESFEDDLDDVQIRFYSGGGTDMVAGLDHMERECDDLEVVVVLTDGYTPFPDRKYDFPVIWCISSDVVAPDVAGETVHFEMVEK